MPAYLYFTSVVYIAMSMIVMFFPHMYGLRLDLTLQPKSSGLIKKTGT
jgi:hypothetical protein